MDDCQEWTGRRNPQGYGKAGWKLAHRLAWAAANGPIPPGMDVLHRCDNPPCVNPAHLWLGTQRDNAADMVEKGRWRGGIGEQHGNHKLTADQVREIRALYVPGVYGHKRLAKRFNTTRDNVRAIVQRRDVGAHLMPKARSTDEMREYQRQRRARLKEAASDTTNVEPDLSALIARLTPAQQMDILRRIITGRK